MKVLRKILLLISLIVLISACQKEPSPYAILPNLEGLSRNEISKKLDRLDIKYQFIFENLLYTSDNEYDKFVRYGQNLEHGDRIEKTKLVTVYTTALPIPTDLKDPVIDFDYTNKTLDNDGIEKVTLARSVDGDTAHFYTQNGEYIKVRFLGVDTPESTMQKEAWGMAASNFMKDLLQNAKTIVIEFDQNGNKVDTYGRYLAYVWADGVLVNLELVQNGYSTMKLSSKSKYFDEFYEAEYKVSLTGRRVWGEIDPNFDYEKNQFK